VRTAGAALGGPRWRRRPLLIVLGVLVALAAALVVLQVIDKGDGFSLLDGNAPERSYLAVFLLIAMDAVVPIFPGETVLNAASTLAAQGSLDLSTVIVVGALGAIVGDSALFWIARHSASRVEQQLERARRNEKIAAALAFLDTSAPLLIIGGRYVPGMRFVVNATMGLSQMSYRRFLPWSVIGGIAWSVYTCLLAYWIGTAIADYPLASILISGLVTTLVLGAVFLVARRHRHLGTS
jgi:membrane protein DedA with SNARE-associated domain